MNIWKLTYNEVHKGDGDVIRVDPAIIATGGDVLEAASILSDQVRGPQSCEDEEGDPLKWEVVGIELIAAVLVCEVDYIDPSLNLRISA